MEICCLNCINPTKFSGSCYNCLEPLPNYMIKDRFSESIKSLDSKNKQLVYKTSNIRKNKLKL